MSFLQYLKDTQGELRHVAWPTRVQTIVYTVIVILLSLFIAVYLGLFDYIFTTGLSRALQFLPQKTPQTIFQPISTTTGDVIIGTDSTSSPQATTPVE